LGAREFSVRLRLGFVERQTENVRSTNQRPIRIAMCGHQCFLSMRHKISSAIMQIE